jgi:hypothetical protein
MHTFTPSVKETIQCRINTLMNPNPMLSDHHMTICNCFILQCFNLINTDSIFKGVTVYLITKKNHVPPELGSLSWEDPCGFTTEFCSNAHFLQTYHL